MRSNSIRLNWLSVLALLLSLPAGIFILFSIMKYELNMHGPFDAIYPALEDAGISESLGWNINLLILFGPMLATLLILLQVFRFNWDYREEQFEFRFILKKRWFTILVGAFSASIVAFLFIYFLGENCNC